VREEIARATGSQSLDVAIADMGDLDQVRTLADTVASRHDHIDVLVHNAGALSAKRHTNADGIEATIASQVLGPFLLTALLLGPLCRSAPGRVVTVSSGGMYASGLTVSELQMSENDYGGSEQYARAKRAQVTLNEMWAERTAGTGVRFHALHPGWADTPGVQESLPTFRRIMGPLLRTPSEGADTLVWLAADDGQPLATNGGFWLDRRRRSLHIVPGTKASDTPERRQRLWAWVAERAGVA
jgi:NAD(P)-dependent dehydrogenase (short-subunit alcohol dehydrogenase family)